MQKRVWHRIRFIRWVIGLVMVCLVVIFLVGVKLRQWSGTGQPVETAAVVDRKANFTINNLDYSEVSEGRTRWTLRAATARYYAKRQETVLSVVRAVFFLEDGHQVELQGDQGILHNASKDIEIQGKVRLTYGDAYRLFTDRLSYDHPRGLFHTSDPVVLEGQGVILKGVGMSLGIAGRTLKILRHVETNLEGFSLSAA